MKEKPFSKYQILANAVMIIWTLAIILPFILLFMSSITDENTLVANGYSFFPKSSPSRPIPTSSNPEVRF